MRPHIRRWHARYRVAGNGTGGALACVENGARARVADAYEAALERAFGDDPAVYVVRQVRTELTIANPSLADEAAIARRWAERTCASVVRTVLRRGDDPSAVMRFDDTADFVARFIADLLDGVAWDRWYYGAFSQYRSMSVDDAIRRVLLDFHEHLAGILRRLIALGRWRAAFARIAPAAARELWRMTSGEEPRESTREQFRLFVHAAIGIANALQLWTRDPAQEDALLGAYCASAPHVPDWNEPRALADAVLAALMFLTRRGDVRVALHEDLARLEDAIADLDWLDRTWLVAAIESWPRHADTASDAEATAAARPPTLTALQRRVLDLLDQLLASGAVTLPDAEIPSERNALALFAALAAAEPLIASHAAVPAVINWFLRSRSREASREKASRTIAETLEIPARYGGVLLLTRVLLEARLTQLAAALGAVPVSEVLLALAAEWTGDSDFDEGLLLWSGFDGAAPREEIAKLDPAACDALRDAVQRLMRDRAAFAPSLAPVDDPSAAPIATIASDLVRLWAHWLPGIGQSSVAWLLRQFVRRRGVLRVDPSCVAVALEPASLDVVLEMAGYLRPIADVPWLGDRRMTFEIDRSLA